MAAGMASSGLKPFVSIYSTFLQRAFDQVAHDVCLPNLPVALIADRAGIIGEDGKTHHGAFDISYLRCLPNVVVAAPMDENELAAPCLHRLQVSRTLRHPHRTEAPRSACLSTTL